jgi:hypothetical protein
MSGISYGILSRLWRAFLGGVDHKHPDKASPKPPTAGAAASQKMETARAAELP